MLCLILLASCTNVDIEPLPEGMVDIFKGLHEDVYGVYAVGLDRDRIHRLLSKSFMGEALTQEYIEHFTTLHKMTDEETAIAIRKIDYNSVEVISHRIDGVQIDADWSVGGIVTHQQHKHPRVNRYRAIYTLQKNASEEWRIVDTKMRNVARVQRAVFSDDEFFENQDAGGGFLDPLDLIDGGVGGK